MPKLSTIPVILREKFKSDYFRREPEPDLIMDEQDQVISFMEAGRQEGALDGVYLYYLNHATRAIQGCKTVVDLACGPSVFLVKLARINPHINFVGLDLSEPMLEKARAHAQERKLDNITFKKCDITDLQGFDDHSVDAVTSMQAFHHLPSYDHLENTFKEVHRILKPEGSIFFQDLIRMKSRHSTIHFAYYDPEAPYLTQLDGERSMRAAFLGSEYQKLMRDYLPANAQYFQTGMVGLYMVVKTPAKPLPADVSERLQAVTKNMRPNSKKYFGDIRFFHKLGGLTLN